MRIVNNQVSVPWFEVDVVVVLQKALAVAKRTGKPVKIWSNDYRNYKCISYAHLEEIVYPDGRCTSPHGMKVGMIWCDWSKEANPLGREHARKAHDGAGETFADIYSGWESQPDVKA